jgi:hypothetical protein
MQPDLARAGARRRASRGLGTYRRFRRGGRTPPHEPPPLLDEPVPPADVAALVEAADAEGAGPVSRSNETEHRQSTARLSQLADEIEKRRSGLPGRAARLDDLTTHGAATAYPRRPFPHTDAGSGDEIPIRDFDTRGMGWLPTETQSVHAPMPAAPRVRGRRSGGLVAQRRGSSSGCCLELTRRGYVASPFTQRDRGGPDKCPASPGAGIDHVSPRPAARRTSTCDHSHPPATSRRHDCRKCLSGRSPPSDGR